VITRTTLSYAALRAGYFRVWLPPVAMPAVVVGAVAADSKASALYVEQRIECAAAPRGPLMLVADSSADMAGIASTLPSTLKAISPGRVVELVVAGDIPASAAPRSWSPQQAQRIEAADFSGGQDDRARLRRRSKRCRARMLRCRGFPELSRSVSPHPSRRLSGPGPGICLAAPAAVSGLARPSDDAAQRLVRYGSSAFAYRRPRCGRSCYVGGRRGDSPRWSVVGRRFEQQTDGIGPLCPVLGGRTASSAGPKS
jgi:hypothetical protein